ncbi:hypothetical protein [Pacificoceanicola onchidii]|uniref:hypothetical protein n=1 Tax=Pacificoceanicola onchidii TaxID=2562685 RepID=UPI0010A62F24|nr:hypothetical protein [Pacificoceanicola onchidii]
MTIHYRISSEHRCIVYRLGDRLHPDMCLEASRLITSDPAFSPDYNFITDLRSVITFDADYKRLSHLATRLKPFYDAMPAEVVYVTLSERDVQFGMSRMFQQIVENSVAFQFHLSRDLPDAALALGLEPQTLQRLLDEARNTPSS